MSARRTAAVLFAGLFALQLVLASVVAACPMWDHGAPWRPDSGAAAGSAMPAALQDALPSMQGMVMIAMSGGTETDDAPCDHPVSPEQCRTMGPCVVGSLAAATASELQLAPVAGTVVATLVVMPPSVTSPPELPPPRA